MISKRTRIIAAFVALYILWGSTYYAMHVAVAGGFPAFVGAGLRMAIAGGVMWAWIAFTAPASLRLTRRDAIHLTGSGFLLFTVSNALTMFASTLAPTSLLALLGATVPFWLAVGGTVVFRERLTGLTLAGIACGFVGVAILVGRPTADPSAGLIIGLVAPCFWALGGLWGRLLRHRPVAVVSTYQMLFGAVGLFVVASVRGEWALLAPTTSGIAGIVYLIVAGSWLGFNSFTYLLANVDAAKVGTYAYVNPLIAVIIGVFLGGESVGPRTFLGGAVIITAVALVNFAKRRALQVDLKVDLDAGKERAVGQIPGVAAAKVVDAVEDPFESERAGKDTGGLKRAP